jgi:hypothetical protein
MNKVYIAIVSVVTVFDSRNELYAEDNTAFTFSNERDFETFKRYSRARKEMALEWAKSKFKYDNVEDVIVNHIEYYESELK